MVQRLAWCVWVVAIGAGCTGGPHRCFKPHRGGALSAPALYLTGCVQADGTLEHKMTPIDPNTPYSYNHEATLHVHDVEGTADHDYYVLVGPDYETKAPARFRIHTTSATVDLIIGWALLAGQMPIAETDLVSTSPEGTSLAIRVQQQTPRGEPALHYVYNLEKNKSIPVVIKKTNQSVDLGPEHCIVVEQDATYSIRSTTDDPFVAHMQASATRAEFVTTRCP